MIGIEASTGTWKKCWKSRFPRNVGLIISNPIAPPNPMSMAAAKAMPNTFGRSGLNGFWGRSAGSRIWNCSPFCRFSRFCDTSASSFFFRRSSYDNFRFS